MRYWPYGSDGMCDCQRFGPGSAASNCGRPQSAANRNMSSGNAHRARLGALAGRRSGLPKALASAGRRCGAGNSASPKRGYRRSVARPDPKPGKTPIAADKAVRVVALTCTTPPHQATHWTGRAMAKAVGISLRSVQRIWQAHQLQPHRIRTFKRSRDPSFPRATKLAKDILSASISIRRHTRWCSRSTRKARSRRSTRTPTGAASSSPDAARLHDP